MKRKSKIENSCCGESCISIMKEKESETKIRHPAIREILHHYKVIWSLSHMSSLASWDQSTYMPDEGAAARAEAMSKVARLTQELFLEKKFLKILEKASSEKNLNEYEKAIVRVLQRSLKFYKKLPSDFLEEFVRTTSEAQQIWKKAKEKNNYELFQPYLEKIIKLSKKKAEYLGYEDHPYDALLDEYEEGLTTHEVEKYFESIKKPLVILLKKIKDSPKYRHEHPLEHLSYDVNEMKKLNQKIIEILHYNLNHIRLDSSPHPFSTTLGPGDTRITTRYEGKDFARSYSSTIHEYGHALYDIQSDEDFHYTPIHGGSSLVLHESQSRFWENFIGRSMEFIELIYNDLIKLNPEIKKFSKRDVYEYVNLVRPSLIRTEADEITYHLHILIRFELEKEMLEGKISADEIKNMWNKKYSHYLGVSPKTDSEGILQDIHWSLGSIGYFPTYSIGTALSAMWKFHLESDVGDLSFLLASEDGIRTIQAWLKKNIHKYGSTFTFRELVKKTTKEDFKPDYLLKYLEEKYNKIY